MFTLFELSAGTGCPTGQHITKHTREELEPFILKWPHHCIKRGGTEWLNTNVKPNTLLFGDHTLYVESIEVKPSFDRSVGIMEKTITIPGIYSTIAVSEVQDLRDAVAATFELLFDGPIAVDIEFGRQSKEAEINSAFGFIADSLNKPALVHKA